MIKITKTEQNILNHLVPVEYGFFHDTYLCGISIENKNEYMYSIRDRVQAWAEKNGGKFTVLSDKVISHRLNKKGFVVQIIFPAFSKRDMKNIMSTLYPRNMQRVYIATEEAM